MLQDESGAPAAISARGPTSDPVCPACPACLSRSVVHVGEAHHLSLWRCRSCRVVFTHPQPRQRLREKYLREYDLATYFESLELRRRVLYERRLAWLPKPVSGRDRLCDVGCADGQFLALAAELDPSVWSSVPAPQRRRDLEAWRSLSARWRSSTSFLGEPSTS